MAAVMLAASREAGPPRIQGMQPGPDTLLATRTLSLRAGGGEGGGGHEGKGGMQGAMVPALPCTAFPALGLRLWVMGLGSGFKVMGLGFRV